MAIDATGALVKITLPWWAYLVAALAVFAGGALALRDHDAHVRLEALYQQTLDTLGHRLDSLQAEGKQIAIATHADTIRIEHWTPVYKTVHDTLLRNVHDTVEVLRFVQAADSTIKACSDLVSDCQARTRILTAQVAAVEAERDLWKKQAPGFLQRHEGAVCTATGILGAVGGFVLGKRL
jgi:hypothetical protein